MRSMKGVLAGAMLGAVDARPVAVVRIAIGLTSLLRAIVGITIVRHAVDPASVPMPYVAWLPRMQPEHVPALAVVWLSAAVAFLVGWRTRTSGAVLACTMGYVVLLDEQTYSNNLYLLGLLVALLGVADSGARYSLDAWRRGPRPVVEAWPVVLLRAQLSIVYGFAALAKLNPDYLSGSVLAAKLRPELAAALDAQGLWVGARISIAVLAFLALAFWVPGLRWAGLVVGALVHMTMIVGLSEATFLLAMFAAQMLTLYLLFFVRITSPATPLAPAAVAAATAPRPPTPPTAPAARPTAAG